MFDTSLLDKTVGDALSAGVSSSAIPGGIWNTEAAQGTQLPCLVFQNLSDILTYGIRGSETLGTYRFLVKAATAGSSPLTARQIDAQAYAALHDATLVVPGVGTVRVRGLNGQAMPDPDGNYMFARFYEVVLTG